MRSAGQLLAHLWMDEESRCGYVRDGGVLCNMWNALGSHQWPIDDRLPGPPGLSPVNFMDGSSAAAGTDASTSITATFGLAQHQLPTSFSSSSTVSKLSALIQANRNGHLSENQLEVRTNVLRVDVRGTVANALSLLGLLSPSGSSTLSGDGRAKSSVLRNPFESSGNFNTEALRAHVLDEQMETLSPTDKQAITVASSYWLLREGQWWTQVSEDLIKLGVVPIDADAAMLMERLETVFDAAESIQFEQMELQDMSNRDRKGKEDVFLGQIIQQKNQEIRSEWLKRKTQHNTKGALSTKVKL